MLHRTLRGGLLAAGLLAAPALTGSPCRVDEAVASFEARQFADARRLFEPCAASDATAALYLGRAWMAQRDFERAIPPLERAAALDPTSSLAQLWLGRAYAQKAIQSNVLRQASLAVKVHRAFERASLLDPNNLDARSNLIDFYLYAPGIMGGSVAKAREQAAEIRRRDPLKGHQAYGRIAEHENQFEAAEAEYVRAAKEFPERTEPYFWRANLALLRKQNARALDILESLAKARPTDAAVDFAIGRLGAQTGESLERAEECLKRYLGHAPSKDEPPLASARYELGIVYEKKGDKEAARRQWQEALVLEPGQPGAKEALAKK